MQERPEDVPVGELPRAVTLVADRHLVGRVAPGTRVTITGIYSIYQVRPSLLVPSVTIHLILTATAGRAARKRSGSATGSL